MEDTVTPAPAGNESPNPEAAPATPPETVTPPETPTKETPADPSDKQEHDWKKRFEGTDQAHKRLSEEHQQVIDTNIKLVEKNPELLDTLAETNPKLADQVSKKLHDKSYSDYRKDKELEALKTSDPDRYEQEKRIRKIEKRDSERTEAERKAFLKDKGIKDNEFDPNYQKVKQQLDIMNPAYVEDNPSEAWEKAYQLAFPAGANPEDAKKDFALAGNTNKKGGLSAILNHKPSKLSPEAQAFRDQMGALSSK